jgi:hypothetical protein
MLSKYSERRADFWHEHVQRWRESGLSKGRYCRVHGLSPNRFGYWAKKYPPEVSAEVALPSIVPLSFTLAPKAPSIGLLVGNRYSLDIPADFDEATLTRLLSVLESRC